MVLDAGLTLRTIVIRSRKMEVEGIANSYLLLNLGYSGPSALASSEYGAVEICHLRSSLVCISPCQFSRESQMSTCAVYRQRDEVLESK